MGGGIHGGFGNTKGSVKPEIKIRRNRIRLPKDDSQIKHIFSEREGHLPDTPGNRRLLLDLANDKRHFKGTDKYGNSWNIKMTDSGQIWVRYQNGLINEGGRNSVPREWNSETGLNKNPVLKRRSKKK